MNRKEVLRPMEMFYSFSAGIDYRRQIMTSINSPVLKGLTLVLNCRYR